MNKERLNYSHYIGIDVSKLTIDVCIDCKKDTFSYENSREGFNKLWLDHRASLNGSLVVVETTGWHEKAVLAFLVMKKVTVHRAAARQVKRFIQSYGTMAKTDSIDARALSKYAKERAENLLPYSKPDKTQDKLQVLYSHYTDLTKALVQEKNRIQSPGYDCVVKSIKKIINILEQQIAIVIDKINKIIMSNEAMKNKFHILKTVDGIGDKTAIALIASMPELGSISRKQAASLSGLAPHPNDSGKNNGYRRTKGGRHNIKEILHMAALGAIRKKDSVLSEFFRHLVNNNHKKKMVALTAVKRKIIVIANARLAAL